MLLFGRRMANGSSWLVPNVQFPSRSAVTVGTTAASLQIHGSHVAGHMSKSTAKLFGHGARSERIVPIPHRVELRAPGRGDRWM